MCYGVEAKAFLYHFKKCVDGILFWILPLVANSGTSGVFAQGPTILK